MSNELSLILPVTDPASFCFIEEERVSLTELEGFADPLPPRLRVAVVVSLPTWINAESGFFVGARGVVGGRGCVAWGVPLVSSTLAV